MNESAVGVLMLLMPIVILVSILIFVVSYTETVQVEYAKAEAQRILDFRNSDHSCDELKRLYLASYFKKYNSMDNAIWYHEVRDRFIDEGCIGIEQLTNLEFIELCMDGRTSGCQISKLKYPEAYENFDFRDAINNVNSTQWQKLGER
jgi:hypothetical protein